MEYRNAQYNADGVTIDCEVNDATMGWVPFTASPNDPEPHGRDLHAQIVADGEAAAYVAPDPEPVPAQLVKDEAYRRIVAIVPEWKQRNLTAQAAILADKGRANWTTDELAAWDAGEALWARVAAIRTASNDIEAMDPIPQDFDDDSYWPE